MKIDQLRKILKKVVVTEKSQRDPNTYVFEVSKVATKTEIKEAVQLLFGVSVLKVRTLNTQVPVRHPGQRDTTARLIKKAYVTLAAGQDIRLDTLAS